MLMRSITRLLAGRRRMRRQDDPITHEGLARLPSAMATRRAPAR
jgi:hypothetical protein